MGRKPATGMRCVDSAVDPMSVLLFMSELGHVKVAALRFLLERVLDASQVGMAHSFGTSRATAPEPHRGTIAPAEVGLD